MATRKNPSLGGKPDKLMREALMLELAEEMQIIGPDGKAQKFKKLRLVARATVNGAIGGDVAAQKLIFDRVDGLLNQKISGTGKNGAIQLETIDPEKLTDDQLDGIIFALGRRVAGAK